MKLLQKNNNGEEEEAGKDYLHVSIKDLDDSRVDIFIKDENEPGDINISTRPAGSNDEDDYEIQEIYEIDLPELNRILDRAGSGVGSMREFIHMIRKKARKGMSY